MEAVDQNAEYIHTQRDDVDEREQLFSPLWRNTHNSNHATAAAINGNAESRATTTNQHNLDRATPSLYTSTDSAQRTDVFVISVRPLDSVALIIISVVRVRNELVLVLLFGPITPSGQLRQDEWKGEFNV